MECCEHKSCGLLFTIQIGLPYKLQSLTVIKKTGDFIPQLGKNLEEESPG